MFGKRENLVNAININRLIDFTLLDPRAILADIEKLCDIAYKNDYYSVCVNPCNVAFAKGYILENFDNRLKVVSVVGFPLGAEAFEIKVMQARQAIMDGADELDVVINIGRAKALDYEYVFAELLKIRKLAKKKIVKAILETCYFDENEIVKLCNVCVKAKVDFVKTSTGFGTGGADLKMVNLMLKAVKGNCSVKASGGIRTRQQAVEFVNLGVKRIGTSSIIWGRIWKNIFLNHMMKH